MDNGTLAPAVRPLDRLSRNRLNVYESFTIKKPYNN